MLIENERVSFGVIDPTVIYITNGTIDWDSGRCERYNKERELWEEAEVIYAKDPEKKFHKGIILTHEVSTIQSITKEDIESMLDDGRLCRDELITFLDRIDVERASMTIEHEKSASCIKVGTIVDMHCGEQGIVVEILDDEWVYLLQCTGHIDKALITDIWPAGTEQSGKEALHELFMKTFGYSGIYEEWDSHEGERVCDADAFHPPPIKNIDDVPF